MDLLGPEQGRSLSVERGHNHYLPGGTVREPEGHSFRGTGSGHSFNSVYEPALG